VLEIVLKTKTSTAFDCGRFLVDSLFTAYPGIFNFLRGVFLSRNNLLLGFSVLVFQPSSLFTA